jgi:hypothetical protein
MKKKIDYNKRWKHFLRHELGSYAALNDDKILLAQRGPDKYLFFFDCSLCEYIKIKISIKTFKRFKKIFSVVHSITDGCNYKG